MNYCVQYIHIDTTTNYNQLGPKGDVRLSRVGPRELQIDADVNTPGINSKSIYIGGVALEFYVKQLIRNALDGGEFDSVSSSARTPDKRETCESIASLLQFDLSDTLPEIIGKLTMAPYQLQNELLFPDFDVDLTTDSVADVIAHLTKLMPVDTSKSLPEVISALLPMFVPGGTSTLDSALNEILPSVLDVLDPTKPLPMDSIMSMLPISFINVTSDTLADSVVALTNQILPTSTTLHDTMDLLAKMFFGRNANAHVSVNSLIKLLPVPVDTSKSTVEIVDAIMQSLPLPKEILGGSLNDGIDALFNVPFDSSNTSLPETTAQMLRIVAGDAADNTLSESISKLLPLPVSSVTTLSELTAITLAMLPSPLNTVTTDELPQIIEELLRVMPLPYDLYASQAKMITALLPTMFPQKMTLYDGFKAVLPVFLGPQADAVMSMSLGQVLPLNINKTMIESVEDLEQLFEFPFKLSLKKTMPENLRALLQTMQLDADYSVRDALPEILRMVLGSGANVGIDQLLPKGIFNQSLPEIIYAVMAIMPVLPMQFDSENTLADVIRKTMQVVTSPLPTGSLQDNMESIRKLVLGPGLSQNVMLQNITTLLPAPFNASQNMANIVTAMLPLLPLPREVLGISIDDVIAEMFKALQMDITKTYAENIAAAYQLIPGFGDLTIPKLLGLEGDVIEGLVLLPLRGGKIINETIAGMLGSRRNDTLVLKLPIDANKTIAENVRRMMNMLPLNQSSIAAVLPLDPKKSIPENINAILKMLPLPKIDTSELAELLPANMTEMSLQTMAQNIAKLLPLPQSMTNTVAGVMSSMIALLPRNETQGIAEAVSTTVSDIMKDPVQALSQSIGAVVPPDVGYLLAADMSDLLPQDMTDMLPKDMADLLPKDMVDMLPKDLDEAVEMAGEINEDVNKVGNAIADGAIMPDPVRAVSDITAAMSGMGGMDMSAPLSKVMSSGYGGGLPGLLTSILPKDVTQGLISMLKLDDSKPLDHVMQQVIATLLQCTQS